MKRKTLLLNSLVIFVMLSSCGGQVTPIQPAKTCDIKSVVEAFYAANDAEQYAQSLQYLAYDVSLVTWGDGTSGDHVAANFAVGLTQIQAFLGKPGLKRTSNGPDLPNYTMQDIQLSDEKVTFMLIPDRRHPNGRPYNPYYVEVFFTGCKIELLKVVERVLWL